MHEELRMQPLPETTTALAALARSSDGDGDRLASSFTAAAETARRIAPDCVGLTLSFLREGMSFTWVATDLRAAVLDGIQYLDGGPCVQAVADEALTVDVEEGPLGERRWQAFAAATAHVGVASTLSIPLMREGRVYGGVNLYARTPHAFDGLHEQLAALFGGWAEGAVTNADLPFSTMARSKRAPEALEDEARSNQAVGMIMAAREVGECTARATLSDAARRAGVSEAEVADFLLTTRLL